MYTYMTRRGILNVCTLHTAYLHVCNLIYLSIQPQYVAICKTSVTVNPLSHCKLSASMAFISIHSLYSHENICPPCKYYCPRTEICGKILSHPRIIFVIIIIILFASLREALALAIVLRQTIAAKFCLWEFFLYMYVYKTKIVVTVHNDIG